MIGKTWQRRWDVDCNANANRSKSFKVVDDHQRLITLPLVEARGQKMIDFETMREAEALAAKLLRVADDHTSAGRHGDSEVVGDAADALLSLLDEWSRQQRN